MDFVTLDFETATPEGNSPCEIGLTVVSEGRINASYGWLIKPPGNVFDYKNIRVHGIKPADVKQSPTFDQLWNEIYPLLNNAFLIAHNASFDLGVLRKTLDYYQLPYPGLHYACSVHIFRRIWSGLSHFNLKFLCDLHQISLNHHRAQDDSLAAAQLCIKAFEEAEIQTMEDIQTKIKAPLWKLSPGVHQRIA
jgi:DNA polymerase-3 subunit epsilon